MNIRGRTERFGNVAAFILVLLFNFLANAVPLGGQTTGEISDRYYSIFTPAGYTFAIWGFIYLALLVFVVWQAGRSESVPPSLSKISIPFKVNCLANSAWICAWHYDQLVLSMLIMVVILGTLVKINSVLSTDQSIHEKWEFSVITVPFGIYFGWISVATIANVSVLQSAYGLNDLLFDQHLWTVLKLLVAGGAGVWFGWRYRNPFYLFVITWAAIGISVANSNQPVVELSAQLLAVVTLVMGIWAWRKRSLHRTNQMQARADG